MESLTSAALRMAFSGQYHAALAMLRESVERCPEAMWYDDRHTNAFWQIAYHALYFTHLYLHPDEAAYVPWAEHQADVQHPDAIAAPADPASDLPLIPEPYTKAQVLAFCDVCDGYVDEAVAALDLASPDCGFPWYSLSKLEHQLLTVRHLQHHAAQLADRLRNEVGVGVTWVRSGPGLG